MHDITETFQKTFTKPAIFTSCQLCSYNVSYNTSDASLAGLQSSTREIQCREYLKLVFFEIPNVRFGTVFQNPVTYIYIYIYIHYYSIPPIFYHVIINCKLWS